MVGKRGDQPEGAIGTTSTIFVPRKLEIPKKVKPGKNYFLVKIHSAQATFSAPIWQKVKQLIVTSSVSLNHPLLGSEPMRAIQRSRSVKRGQTEKLGMSPNLIDIVPATMTKVSIYIEFILDMHNRMSDLAALINDNAFVAAVSLTPLTAAGAKTVSGISQKLIQTFIPPDQRQPILKFGGDFNIHAYDLCDGYYVILGTRDEDNPLPRSSAVLEVQGVDLLVDGKPANNWSYVILDVCCIDVRTRDPNDNASWNKKLKDAEAIAERLNVNPFADPKKRHQGWEECMTLINEAHLLINDDPNYLAYEANAIIKDVYVECREKIFEDSGRVVKASRVSESIDLQHDRSSLGIALDEDLDATLNLYKRQVAETQRILKEEAQRYKEFRKTMPAGPQRTTKMTSIVKRMREALGEDEFTSQDIRAYLQSDDEGNRLVGLSILESTGTVDYFEQVLKIIDGDSKSGFEQYHALRAVKKMLPNLDSTKKRRLQKALDRQREYDEGKRQWIKPGSDRWWLSWVLLSKISE